MRADREADFEAFVAASADRFFRTAYAITRDDESAADAVRAALAATYSRWSRVGAGQPESYVRRMIVNEILGRGMRRSSAVRPITGLPSQLPAPAPGQRVLDTDVVWAALQQLPVSQRALIVLRYYERLSTAEIGSTLGIRPETVGPQAVAALSDVRRLVTKMTRHGAHT